MWVQRRVFGRALVVIAVCFSRVQVTGLGSKADQDALRFLTLQEKNEDLQSRINVRALVYLPRVALQQPLH